MSDKDGPSVVPAVIGIAITCGFLLLLGYLAQKRTAQENLVPHLSITTPLPNAAVDSPLVVRFTSMASIELRPTGWSYGTMHLHAWLNDVQYMPATADIRRLGDHAYEWTFPAVQRNSSAHLRLGWADAQHRPLPAGNSAEVAITIR